MTAPEKRLVASIVVRGPIVKAFTDPDIHEERAPDTGSLVNAVLGPRRAKYEQAIEAIRQAGYRAWEQREETGP